MVLRTRCALTLSSCAPDALGKDDLLMTKEPEMKVAFKQLQAVLECFYLMACFLLEVAQARHPYLQPPSVPIDPRSGVLNICADCNVACNRELRHQGGYS